MAKRKKMLILCPYPRNTGAGQRMKYEPYIEDWESQGWDVTISNFMTRPMFEIAWTKGNIFQKTFWTILGFATRIYDIFRIQRYDLVYIYMWVTPFFGVWFENMVRSLARSIIYDIEDNVLEPPREPHPLVPRIIAGLMDRTEKVRYLAKCADAVVIASPFLVDSVGQLRAKNIFVIPPSLDMDRMRPRPANALSNSLPIIGWTGTITTMRYLDLMAEPLRELSKRRRFRFRVITNFDYEMPGVDLEVIRWTVEQEVELLQSFDIGVYPLVDDAWTRGKAGLKIIQYQAIGVPCVASDAPLSRLQVEHGKTGFIARSVNEWVDLLELLLDDPCLRSAVGQSGRLHALDHYSRQKVKMDYRKLIGAAIK